jgi:sugar phosphate isomerase/epimerase
LEFRPHENMKIAFAPYHLENLGVDALGFGRLIEQLGNNIAVYYAWQHGMGCMKKLPKEQELLQMPGRGDLDFTPSVAALKRIGFTGFTEIFMHPVPRGIPILPTARETTEEINRGRAYLEGLLKKL